MTRLTTDVAAVFAPQMPGQLATMISRLFKLITVFAVTLILLPIAAGAGLTARLARNGQAGSDRC